MSQKRRWTFFSANYQEKVRRQEQRKVYNDRYGKKRKVSFNEKVEACENHEHHDTFPEDVLEPGQEDESSATDDYSDSFDSTSSSSETGNNSSSEDTESDYDSDSSCSSVNSNDDLRHSEGSTLEEKFENEYILQSTLRKGSEKQQQAIWSLFRKVLQSDRLKDGIKMSKKSYVHIKRKKIRSLPSLSIEADIYEKSTGRTIPLPNLPQFPRKKYRDKTKYVRKCVITKVKLKDLYEYHKEKCPERSSDVSLSIDGVNMNSVKSKSLDIITCRFGRCSCTYPVRTCELGSRYKLQEVAPVERFFVPVLEELEFLQLRLTAILADRLMRAYLLGLIAHTTFYSCELCVNEGQKIPGFRNICFLPQDNERSQPRRPDDMKRIVSDFPAISNIRNVTLRRKRLKGIKYPSQLWLRPGYDIQTLVVLDSMHILFLGVIPRTFHLCFKVPGANKFPNYGLTRRLQLQSIEEKIKSVRLPSEIQQRPREIINYKAHEWRTVGSIYCPLVKEICRPKPIIEELWTLLCFLTRLLMLPKSLFDIANNSSDLQGIFKHTESLYHAALGGQNLTYNTHVFFSHGRNMRHNNESVSLNSNFLYENSYIDVRTGVTQGVESPGKQLLSNCLLKRKLRLHFCKKQIRIAPYFLGDSTDDSLVCHKNGKYFKVKRILQDDYLECREIQRKELDFYYDNRSHHLNLSLCHWFFYEGIKESPTLIRSTDVIGKVTLVDGNQVLMTPLETLHEK